jgi:hypothetical protein
VGLNDPVPDNRSQFLASLAAAQAAGHNLDEPASDEVTPDCIAPLELAQLASGILDDSRVDAVYVHLGHCTTCCRVLARARESMSSETTTAEEQLIRQFERPSSRLQKELGRRYGSRRWPVIRFTRWVLISAVAIAAISVAYISLRSPTPSHVAGLLAEAYAAGRPIQYRLSLPGYGKELAEVRGGGVSVDLRALHRAEDELSGLNERSRHQAEVLRLAGVVRMFHQQPQQAAEALEQAAAIAPDNVAIQIDLAAAIAFRGDVDGRREDYAAALNCLTKVLQRSPSNPTILFNLALISEKMALYNEAERHWNEFLKADSTSPWKDEAIRHLRDVVSKKNFVR